ncbi:MAG: hypothetical protein JWM98_1434 [Thermoleophilia bacterium]|nr:hypothetical protein [Thermoleophilia bacterium]
MISLPSITTPAPAILPGGCVIPPRPTNCWDPREWSATLPTRPAAPTTMPYHNCWDPRTWGAAPQAAEAAASIA